MPHPISPECHAGRVAVPEPKHRVRFLLSICLVLPLWGVRAQTQQEPLNKPLCFIITNSPCMFGRKDESLIRDAGHHCSQISVQHICMYVYSVRICVYGIRPLTNTQTTELNATSKRQFLSFCVRPFWGRLPSCVAFSLSFSFETQTSNDCYGDTRYCVSLREPAFSGHLSDTVDNNNQPSKKHAQRCDAVRASCGRAAVRWTNRRTQNWKEEA